MQRLRWILLVLLLLLIFGGALTIGLAVRRALAVTAGPQMLNTATVLTRVQALAQLITVKYVMEKVVVYEDVKWFGENRVLMIAHGVVKAGVDLGALKPEDVVVTDRKIQIRLPPPQITDAYLDEKQTRVVERTTGLLRAFDKDLEQAARQNAVDDIRRAARLAGIQKDAEERARLQLKLLFQQMGFEQIEFVSR